MTHRYKTSYRGHRGLSRFAVFFNGPTYETKEDRLQAIIEKEQTFQREYPNYIQLCKESEARMNETARSLQLLLSVRCIAREGIQSFWGWYEESGITFKDEVERVEMIREHLDNLPKPDLSDQLQAFMVEHWDQIPEIEF